MLRSRKCKCLCGVDRQHTNLLDIKFKLNLFQVAARVFMKFKFKSEIFNALRTVQPFASTLVFRTYVSSTDLKVLFLYLHVRDYSLKRHVTFEGGS